VTESTYEMHGFPTAPMHHLDLGL